MTTTRMTPESPPRMAVRYTLAGRVQGIGMRPAIARFARRLGLAGIVENTRNGVVVHIEGPAADVERFDKELQVHLPAAADVASLQRVRVAAAGFETFLVRRTENRPTGEELSALVPPDVISCDACLAEVRDAGDRRRNYPFTSCTDCGPRYSIIEQMPYEREQTSMAAFTLCQHCRIEYESPENRRFHAQTNACPDCGPQIWLRDACGQTVARQQDAISAAAAAINNGRIVALRGLGGYQLLADAVSQEAVRRLRQRKQRDGKPLAVMVSSLAEAAKLARLDEVERRLLRSPAGPIVVAVARTDSHLAPSVTAGLNTIGLMLPATPLHWLLLAASKRPLVCTSGNVEGEPLVFREHLAIDQLRGIADVWLEHDRPIRRPIDDSVVRVMAGRPVTIRLARGYAPLPLRLETSRPLTALGGHQKNSIALCNGAQAVLGPHVGDLDTLAARQRFVEQADDLSRLYGIDDFGLVCDSHPEYFTTTWAQSRDCRAMHVNHHHAHIAAGMLEHGWLDRQVLGVAFDGTGYGLDGSIWGGEFLLATAAGFQRVGHLRPFALPGGEAAVRQPWRVATALVRDAAGDGEAARLSFRSGDAQSLSPVLQNPRLSPRTTSAGRLFDGAAALILGIEQCQFEGQAAMLLESACDLSATGQYDISIDAAQTKQLDWRWLVRQILLDRAAGVSPGQMAARFHRGLASAIVEFCRSFSSLPVVLGGGVFQNRILVEMLAARFAETNQPLGLPGRIPPNDGGLAAGQLAVAAALAQQQKANPCV